MVNNIIKIENLTVPRVSVFMITYNHENYVEQAIESILMQKTAFPFEIVIGEDRSTDKTREICIKYQKKYPKIIRLLENSKNLGIKDNFLRTLNETKGEFVAYLEGDDYWINKDKLQKQVDFLEKNTDFSIVCHRAKILDMGKGSEYVLSDRNVKEVSTVHDLCKQNLIYANSVLFRVPQKRFEGFELDSAVADWVLWVYLAQFGKIKYFREPMSVYRKHDGGVFSKKNDAERINMALVAADNWNRITRQKYIDSYREVSGLCYLDLLKIVLAEGKSMNESELVSLFQKIASSLPNNQPLIEAVKNIRFSDTPKFSNPYLNMSYKLFIKCARYIRLVLGKIQYAIFK